MPKRKAATKSPEKDENKDLAPDSKRRKLAGDDENAIHELESIPVPEQPVAANSEPTDFITCPYLYTINRNVLDFDFEKKCSVSLATTNVYCCLVCGQYFQGRTLNTYASIHSMEADHHVFINMKTRKFYCLPDDYEIVDSSLDDIRENADPCFTANTIMKLDKEFIESKTMDNHQVICGVVGLNNVNNGDHINAILQCLLHLPRFRNIFINQELNIFDGKPASALYAQLGNLARKIWNTKIWRSNVSPQEFIKEASLRSEKKYSVGVKGDSLDFYSWLVNTLHRDVLTAQHKSVKNSSFVTDLFQGQVMISTEKLTIRKSNPNPSDSSMSVDGPKTEVNKRITPFFFLQLDLPTVTLLKDERSKSVSEQIPIYPLLSKYDGQTVHYKALTKENQSFHIVKLPSYLVLFVKRFTQNMYLIEKNKTIVNFPVDELDMAEYCSAQALKLAGGDAKYTLRAYVSHTGDAKTGSCIARFHHIASGKWYNCQDVHVDAILPEAHFVAEAYILFYEKNVVV